LYAIPILLLFLAILAAQTRAHAQMYQPGITSLYGDCTASGNGPTQITCTKSNGVPNGSMASQSAANVAISGGSISGAGIVAPTLSLSGHFLNTSALTPTVSGCGSGASIAGNDNRWVLTTGAGLGTCTITFATAFSAAPVCVVTSNTTGEIAVVTAVSATSISVTLTSLLSSAVIRGVCVG
jgi:hypothetical protein